LEVWLVLGADQSKPVRSSMAERKDSELRKESHECRKLIRPVGPRALGFLARMVMLQQSS